MAAGGAFIQRGAKAPALRRDRKWTFTPSLKKGDTVSGGDILGTVPETGLIEHRIMVPHGISGTLQHIGKGDFTIEETIARVEQDGGKSELTLMQRWPVRKPRPYRKRFDPSRLLVTGMRIIDYMFPLALGGKGAIPGGFGTGKTVALQQLARWAQTQLNIYVGCGERGNEMADVLSSFKKLRDPARPTGSFWRKRSSSPTPRTCPSWRARRASSSASRSRSTSATWATTCCWSPTRPRAGRRPCARSAAASRRCPGEEGFPAYLGSSLSSFYERAGLVQANGSPERTGSVTIAGAVSPPGADFSEPVTQHTLRIVDAFYSLDVALANRRHFPDHQLAHELQPLRRVREGVVDGGRPRLERDAGSGPEGAAGGSGPRGDRAPGRPRGAARARTSWSCWSPG